MDQTLGRRLAASLPAIGIGLALLVPLSLLWMARRVRKRGGFGRKAGAVLRSLWAVVLGLGGWFAGVPVEIDGIAADGYVSRESSWYALSLMFAPFGAC